MLCRTTKILFLALMCLHPAQAWAEGLVQSLTLEGGPVASKHFQAGEDNFHERHGLGIAKIHTASYGNWGVYVLAPNSVNNTSIGAGYVTDPYVIPLGPAKLEFSAGLGLVTGYQNYPIPLVVGESRLVLFDRGSWDAGLSVAAIPYYMLDESPSRDNKFGIVATTPFLSVRYKFANAAP